MITTKEVDRLTMRVMLAPMEGVLDPLVRELLTAINDYELCVTEFLRVVNTLLPAKTFYRLCPELHNKGYTRAGTAVRVQLLGSEPGWMAENAQRAVELGSQGIDINCGCPAKKVVGSEGGASLLRYPELIYRITTAVRSAVPAAQTVSVKIRLGWDSAQQCHEIADAVQQGGATELVVHGRTKEDGYQADKINWQAIGELRRRLSIPVIANGEIDSYSASQQCRQITGCDTLMVGRGALNLPNLGNVIKYCSDRLSWQQVLSLLQRYLAMENPYDSGYYHLARVKQWAGYLRKEYSQGAAFFAAIRPLTSPQAINDRITADLIALAG